MPTFSRRPRCSRPTTKKPRSSPARTFRSSPARPTTAVNLANTFNTIERRDVGITLRITPQISEGGSVRLDIFEEVSKVDRATNPQLGPTTSIRSATTTVVAKDGQTVVIGGLISDDNTKDKNQVPFFGDIPVIGNFFKTTTSIIRR